MNVTPGFVVVWHVVVIGGGVALIGQLVVRSRTDTKKGGKTNRKREMTSSAGVLGEKVREAILSYMNKPEYEHHLMDLIEANGHGEVVPRSAKLVDVTQAKLVFMYEPVMEGYGTPGGLFEVALPFPISTTREAQDALKQLLDHASHQHDDMAFQVDQKRDSVKARK
jgi:hypothetical protein